MMESIFEFFAENIHLLDLCVMGALLAALVLTLVLMVRVQKLRKQYETLIAGAGSENVEQVLLSYLKKTNELEKRAEEAEKRIASLDAESETHLQNFGMVRYNAFDGVGGEQSFSLALLDDHKNGVAITGIYGRAETRVYAKPIDNGISKYTLSPEENEAIERAKARQVK